MGAESSPISVKVGSSITIANGYRKIRYYKNGSSTYTTFTATTELESNEDFMYLGGHNYGCAFLCLQDATYVFKNPSEYGAQKYTYPVY